MLLQKTKQAQVPSDFIISIRERKRERKKERPSERDFPVKIKTNKNGF
jgi:hypothetical protein